MLYVHTLKKVKRYNLSSFTFIVFRNISILIFYNKIKRENLTMHVSASVLIIRDLYISFTFPKLLSLLSWYLINLLLTLCETLHTKRKNLIKRKKLMQLNEILYNIILCRTSKIKYYNKSSKKKITLTFRLEKTLYIYFFSLFKINIQVLINHIITIATIMIRLMRNILHVTPYLGKIRWRSPFDMSVLGMSRGRS